MSRNKKHFTFLYVPGSNRGLKTFRVRKSFVWAVAVTVVTLSVGSAVTTMRYATRAADAHRLAQLDRENALLRGQLAELRGEVGSLRGEVEQNFAFQKKARLLANLEDLNEDVTEVGVGGSNSGYLQSLSVLAPEDRLAVTSLRDDIGKLLRQAKLQSDSYREIVDSLGVRQARLSATPSIRPVLRGYVSSRFGRRMDPFTGRSSFHGGVDYSVRLGSPIVATADGVVTYAGKLHGFGLVVEISHGHGYVTRYAHCSKVRAQKGQRIQRGDEIAMAGRSGRATATHLHYEVIYKGKKKDPLRYVLADNEILD